MKAYILVEVDTGTSLKEIIKGRAMSAGLDTYEGVISTDVVYGEYDLVIVVEGDPATIDGTLHRIRSLPFIKKTVTLLSLVLKE